MIQNGFSLSPPVLRKASFSVFNYFKLSRRDKIVATNGFAFRYPEIISLLKHVQVFAKRSLVIRRPFPTIHAESQFMFPIATTRVDSNRRWIFRSVRRIRRAPYLLVAMLALAAAATWSISIAWILAGGPFEVASPFVWIGNVTSSSFTVHVDIATVGADVQNLPLIASSYPSLLQASSSVVGKGHFPKPHASVMVFILTGLRPGTKYYFGFESKSTGSVLLGSVSTFPSSPSAEVFVALGSCQKGSGNARTLAKMASALPDSSNAVASFAVHLGDLHYKDIESNDMERFKSAMVETVTTKDASQLFSSHQVTYVYDDHDYGGNNGDASSRSRLAALTNYDRMVPHPQVPAPSSIPANYHAFTVASVRFVITDLRSDANKTGGFLMGPVQLKWFFDELRSAKKYSVVVWASSRPWIGPVQKEKDHWGAFNEQRKQIADFIAVNEITNMVLVAGDAHMLAADDGTNSNYAASTFPPAGFPVLQSAPFANRGSSKGGPFTEGCYAYRYSYNYHFAILRIYKTNHTDGPCISFQGYAVDDDNPKITFDKCGKLGGVRGKQGGGQGPVCKIKLFRSWQLALIILFSIFLLSAPVACVIAACWRRSSKCSQ